MEYKKVSLDEVCFVSDFVANGSFASLKSNVEYLSEPGFAILVRVTDFVKNWKRNFVYISKESYDFLNKTKLCPGDIIIASVGEPGKAFMLPDLKMPMSLGPNSVVVRTDINRLLNKFFFYYILSKEGKRSINNIVTGSAVQKFNKTAFRKLEIPLPNIESQHQIVEKIEELFSELDNAVATLKTTQQQLQTYRQSVLKHAFESEQIELLNVEDCSTHVIDCLHSTAKFVDDGFYCVDTTCIENGKILFERVRYVNLNTFQERISRLKPQAGDILFAREGTVGTTVIVPENVELCLGQRMMMFRLKAHFSPKYISYYFQSPQFKSQYRPLIGGTTAPHLNIRDIRKFKVPDFSLQQQENIILEIETRLSESDNLLQTINQQLTHAESLRQSILQKAFRGELVYVV